MHRDTIIGIVGVVILVAAMVGVFTYERGQASSLGPADGGTTQSLAGPSLSGNVAVTATDVQDIMIDQTGMTNITFTLRWTPGNGVDTLILHAAPGNDTGMTQGFDSAAESDGEITLVIPLNNTGVDGRVGTGNWRVSVEFVSASPTTPLGPAPVQPPVVPPGTTDTAVDYTVDTSLQAYGGQN